jgi:hypothetical protein
VGGTIAFNTIFAAYNLATDRPDANPTLIFNIGYGATSDANDRIGFNAQAANYSLTFGHSRTTLLGGPGINLGGGNWSPTSGTAVEISLGGAGGEQVSLSRFLPIFGTASYTHLRLTPTINQAAITGTVAGSQVAGNTAIVIFSAPTSPGAMTSLNTTTTVTVGTNTSINGAGNTPTVVARTNQTVTNSVESRVALTLSSVANASGGNTVYTGTITSGGTTLNGNFVGVQFVVAGFTNGANNGTFTCVASTTTTLTLSNAAGASETHAATATYSSVTLTTGAGSAYAAADYIYVSGLTVLTWINTKVMKVLTAVGGTSVTFADPTGHAASGSQADTGTVVCQYITYSKTTADINLSVDTGTAVQQATGNVTDILLNSIETAIGGTHLLMDLQAGAAGTTSKLSINNSGTIVSAGGYSASFVSKSGSYTLTANDYAVQFTATATATLPASQVTGKIFRLKVKAGTLTVTPAAGLIDDAASVSINVANQSIDVMYDGTNWQIF